MRERRSRRSCTLTRHRPKRKHVCPHAQSRAHCAQVLLIAVDQRHGVCGRGFGTRLVNFLKVADSVLQTPSQPMLCTQPLQKVFRSPC
eukprot:6189005-Pleurochrysis_carterae.AAC.4